MKLTTWSNVQKDGLGEFLWVRMQDDCANIREIIEHYGVQDKNLVCELCHGMESCWGPYVSDAGQDIGYDHTGFAQQSDYANV